jgi:two-component system chemotaxis response regulator CheY
MPDRTILTVDDSATIRGMLRATLSTAGYRVVQAVDGLDALEVLESEAPDVIITDINMPRMNGIKLIEELRGGGRYRATPILVLTTESAPQWKSLARDAGATGWISKPFDPAKLTDALRRVMA